MKKRYDRRQSCVWIKTTVRRGGGPRSQSKQREGCTRTWKKRETEKKVEPHSKGRSVKGRTGKKRNIIHSVQNGNEGRKGRLSTSDVEMEKRGNKKDQKEKGWGRKNWRKGKEAIRICGRISTDDIVLLSKIGAPTARGGGCWFGGEEERGMKRHDTSRRTPSWRSKEALVTL